MDRFRKTKNKNIWWTIFWVVVLAIAFIASVYSRSKASSTEVNDQQQQPSAVYTCYAESVSSIGVGVSPDRPTAVGAALRACQRQSPSWQTCRLSGCVPR